VQIAAPEGGVRLTSYALVDQIHSVDRSRLLERCGAIDHDTHRRIASLLLRIIAPR
jgi:mRNA-degrading endonuclease toxin of MazEF toxin-antitoxin module